MIDGWIEPGRAGKNEWRCFRYKNVRGENKRIPLSADVTLVDAARALVEADSARVVEVSAFFEETAPGAGSTPIAVWMRGGTAPTESELEAYSRAHTVNQAAAQAARAEERGREKHQLAEARRRERDAAEAVSLNVDVRDDVFLNPYAFVLAPERTASGAGGLGDQLPVGLERSEATLWSGRIAMTMIVQSPVLVLDSGRRADGQPEGTADGDAHREYRTLTDRDGKPVLPGSMIKGALSAHYEAITNSRYRVFQGHKEPLWRRMEAAEGAGLVPACIANGGTEVLLFWGMEDGSMPAAWLPYYRERGTETQLRSVPRHGQHVVAELHLHEKRSERHQPVRYWRVHKTVAIPAVGSDVESALKAAPLLPAAAFGTENRTNGHVRLGGDHIARVEGLVVVSGANADRKHDERLFFRNPKGTTKPLSVPFEPLRSSWESVLRNYRDDGGDAPAAQPSRHVAEDWYVKHVEQRDYSTPAYCYAEVDATGQVRRLIPVPIARAQYNLAPDQLVSKSILPLASQSQSSPADRLFGFSCGEDSRRSAIRVHEVDNSKATTTELRRPIPLATLQKPKQYGRFALVSLPGGSPLAVRRPAFYESSDTQQLAGRKFYWTHRDLPASYWDSDRSEQLATGRYREFVHPANDEARRTKLNRSVGSWIATGSVFTVTLDVANLSDVELGALLWMLDASDKQSVARPIGYGKPLGFGSTKWELALERCTLLRGSDVVHRYDDLTLPAPVEGHPMTPEDVRTLIDSFRSAAKRAWNTEEIEEAPHIAQYLAIARGKAGVAVRYPRMTAAPDPEGESYVWFVSNEGKKGLRAAAGDPAAEQPWLPHKPLT